MQSTPVLTIGHSPDPDDAFMWWPLGDAERAPEIDTEGLRFEPVAADIQELNERAIATGDLDLSAVSMHTYARVHDRYALTSCGASMGDGYGPKVVARAPIEPQELVSNAAHIGIPGLHTSAYLALQLALGAELHVEPMAFDRIVPEVCSGRLAAGVVIHEAQLTYAESDLHLVLDLGKWWTDKTTLPLPLGANVVRRDLEATLGPGSLETISRVLTRSIRFAMEHRERGLEVASSFTSVAGTSAETVDRFVSMYVNDLTIDLGVRGRDAIERFLRDAAEMGLCPPVPHVQIVGAGA